MTNLRFTALQGHLIVAAFSASSGSATVPVHCNQTATHVKDQIFWYVAGPTTAAFGGAPRCDVRSTASAYPPLQPPLFRTSRLIFNSSHRSTITIGQ
jgi:hypothetical protein